MNKLRKLLTSVPVITVISMMVVYLALGFLVVPAVLKWQLEKQVAQRGHVLTVDAIRFNPLRLELEVDGLKLSDAKGQAMAGFAQLSVDMLWRGIVDGAWSFADARLVSPQLRLELLPDGRSNFSDLLDQFASQPAPEGSAATEIPRLRVAVLAISGGSVEWFDQTLAQPLVTHVRALSLDLRGLSTLAQERTRYRLAAMTEANESLDLQGEFGLDPLLVQGQLALQKLQIATLARGLSRLLELQAPTGQLSLAAGFDLAPDAQGVLAGKVHGVSLDMADVSLQAPGASAPLLAAKTIQLHDGLVDLAERDVRFGRFVLRDGGVAMALDGQGQGDWMRMLRVTDAAKPTAGVAPPAAPASAPAVSGKDAKPAPTPATQAGWRVAIGDVQVAGMAVAFQDPPQNRSLAIAALQLGAAPSMQLDAGSTAVTLGKLQLTLSGLQFDDGASAVSAPVVQADMGQSVVRLAGDSLDSQLDTLRLALAQGLSVRQGDNSATIGASSLESPSVKLGSGAGSGKLTAGKPHLQLSTVAAKQSGLSAGLDKLDLSGERLAINWDNGNAGLLWGALAMNVSGLLLKDAVQDLEFSLASLVLADPSLALAQADTGLTAKLQTPDLRLKDMRGRLVKDKAALAELRIGARALSLSSKAAALDLNLAGLNVNGQKVSATRGQDAVELAQLAWGNEALELALNGNAMKVSGKAARIALAGTRLRQGQDKVDLKDAVLTVRSVLADRAATSGPNGATNARLQDTLLTLDTLGLARGAGKDAFAQLTGARLSAGNLALVLSDAPPDLRGETLGLNLRGVSLRDPAVDGGAPLLQLGETTVNGAVFSLKERSLLLDSLAAKDARADLWLDAKGQLNLVELMQRLSGAAPAETPAASASEAATAKAVPSTAGPQTAGASADWRIAVKQADVSSSSVQFEDRGREQPFAMGVDGITLQLLALDTGASGPMQVDLRAALRSGGSLSAKGAVQPLSGAADLQLAADGVVLAPAQSYLAQYLELTLTSGTASSQGRLVLSGGAPDVPQVTYTGGFAVDKLQLQENTPQRPFLSWDSVASKDIALALKPDRLDIGELQVQGLDGRLIIAQDLSINLTDVLKKREPDAPGETPRAAADATPDAPAKAAFPVNIARVRVSDGVLDFADLSLRPQFGTRMHQLKGVITGLSTDPERVAKVQLDARVDKFGSARIRGQASVLQPEKLTEIDVTFRNLEMTSLSPYVVKFAGYEIASGKLSLDLQYKVRDGKLLGANKVVLNQMALGKKVESPGALDLPLDLALAVLKDSKGVIDIGLPVSGDLNDPKFDYGAVIAKAIGNVLGGIVTAPFRALAALFGGGSDAAIGTIDFEPGSAELAPPEQQKIETVARALLARPQLMLKVPPVFAAGQDTPVLQSRAVRADIARSMGLSLAPSEDPGPIDVADPRAAAAIEAAFSARYAPAVLDLLKQRARVDKPTGAAPDTAVAPQSPASASASAGATIPITTPAIVAAGTASATTPVAAPPATAPAPELEPGFHQRLLDRMIAEQVVSAQDLRALAQRRAQGIMDRLTDDDGVPADRVALAQAREATNATDKVVPLKLELEAAR